MLLAGADPDRRRPAAADPPLLAARQRRDRRRCWRRPSPTATSSPPLSSCASRPRPPRRLDRVTRQQRLTLIATILGSTVVFLDATVVNVALPAISEGLDAGLAGQQWVVEAYMLALVSLLLVGGSLGDQFGRRRMFVIGPDRLRRHLGALRDRPDRRVPDRCPRAAGDRRGAARARARWRSSPRPSRARRAARRSAPGPPGPGSRPCSARPAAAR